MKNDPLIEILKKEFAKKQAKNHAYSLRSYSRDLGIDPSNLSKILNYQKEMGSRLRAKLGKELGFDKTEIESWLKPANHAKTVDRAYAEHTMQVFQVVSEWQHYAILELFKVADADLTPQGIAASLGLTLSKTKESLKRLTESGLLLKTAKGYTPADESSSSILSVATSKAHREQQAQILEGAIEALKNTPIELRSQSSVTMAIDINKLDEAKELIKTFRRDMGRLLSASAKLDEVYQLSVSLYPVTKTKKIKAGENL